MSRFRVLVRILPILAVLIATATTQSVRAESSGTEPRAKSPRAHRGERAPSLDFLFGALKVAPDAASAKAIEDRIWAQWIISRSDTANLLMTRVKTAVEEQDLDLALKLLDAMVKIAPKHVEAWNRRATLRYMKKDYSGAIADIRQVLILEPRHFGAMSGLGLILQDIGDDKHALEVYRRALAVHPHLPRLPDLIKTLSQKIEGRDI